MSAGGASFSERSLAVSSIAGCTHVSPACDHCYAERDNKRRVRATCRRANGGNGSMSGGKSDEND
jgi:protein gp37